MAALPASVFAESFSSNMTHFQEETLCCFGRCAPWHEGGCNSLGHTRPARDCGVLWGLDLILIELGTRAYEWTHHLSPDAHCEEDGLLAAVQTQMPCGPHGLVAGHFSWEGHRQPVVGSFENFQSHPSSFQFWGTWLKKKKSTSLFPNILEETFSIFMLPLTSLLFLYPATKCCLPTQFLLKLGWVEIHFFGSSWKTSFCDQRRTPGGSAQWEISSTAPPASPLEGGSSWEVLLRNLNLWVPAEARWRTRGATSTSLLGMRVWFFLTDHHVPRTISSQFLEVFWS